MRPLLAIFTLSVATLAAPVFAHADTYDVFTIQSVSDGSNPNPFSLTFTVNATPTVTNVINNHFTVITSSMRNGIADTDDPMEFYLYTGPYSGGVSDLNSIFEPYGPQVFRGGIQNPTFILGSYNLSNEAALGGPTDYILTIAAAPVSSTPEPSSLALFTTGALGFAAAARRRLGR